VQNVRSDPGETLWQHRARQARLVAALFLVTIPCYAVAGEALGALASLEIATVRLGFFIVSATAALLGFQLRARWIPAAVEDLRRSPNDAQAAQRWHSAHYISLAIAEGIGLFGFALRILGGTLFESLPFYIISFGLILAWFPRRPD
jgi:hypothetical protein